MAGLALLWFITFGCGSSRRSSDSGDTGATAGSSGASTQASATSAASGDNNAETGNSSGNGTTNAAAGTGDMTGTAQGGASSTAAPTSDATSTTTSDTITASDAGGAAGNGETAASTTTSVAITEDWRESCAGVPLNGQCADNVFEWCDPILGEVMQRDCTPLGLTCRAEATEPNEFDLNGCIGETCENDDTGCDGALEYQCHNGELIVTDCRKLAWLNGTCSVNEEGFPMCEPEPRPCDEFSITCDGSLLWVCHDGSFYVVDCARSALNATCEVVGERTVQCGESSTSFL
ncbi:MAG TPA: hypothetical protein VI197_08745 [Polyangiaceae bacterium]